MSNIYQKMAELMRVQETFAVATIVNYRGSVPRQIAKMIITKDQKTYGTIGGGCVAGQVEEEFGGVGMNCGGKIDVSIEIAEPNPRLIIIGSGHLSSAIAKLAQLLG